MDLARAAYPVVLMQLTAQGPLEKHTYVDFVHPATRARAPRDEGSGKEAS